MVMKPARILVVDDEPGMLRAVERVLSGDHHVIGTRLSRDALSVADQFHPELAILGIRMPDRHLRYVNAGHPPIVVWGSTRKPLWLESTGPLVSPVLTASTWDAPVVSIDVGDHLLLYTDGVWETLADEDGRAEERFTSAIDRASGGGAPLLDAILADVHHELAGRLQPDDLTLLTAGLVGPINQERPG